MSLLDQAGRTPYVGRTRDVGSRAEWEATGMVSSGRWEHSLRWRFLLGVLSSLGLGWYAPLRADVFLYDGFGDSSGLTLNAAAASQATGDGTVMRLTPAVSNTAGSIFTTSRVDTQSFLSTFSFRITGNGGPAIDNNPRNGADGLVFLVQNQNATIGNLGLGIGYQGISPSLAVEFDTWRNDSLNDPSPSHLGITLNGDPNHGTLGSGSTVNIGDTDAPTTALPGPELDAGDRWWAWVRYQEQRLDVFLLQSESTTEPSMPLTPLLGWDVDLAQQLGGDQAFVGFTSATRAAWANHDLIYWRYAPPAAVPEPTGLATGCLMSLALASLRRRR